MNARLPTTRRTIHAIRPEDVTREPIGTPGLLLGGKYRLERRIATGGSASIWCATHVTLDRPVAVKFVDAPGVGEHSVDRFLREAKVAASVRHKNVVDILDFGVHESGGTAEPYMIMELLEGEALDLMLRRVPLSTADTVSVVWQVLSGLEAVHEVGIVHRDMKPGNVFLTHDHDGLFARVLDFGISQSTDDDAEDHLVIGTPEYMSPEQALGEALDRRTDVYSAGVMLYEMLAGFLPFDDRDPLRVLELVADAHPPSLAAARPDTPALCGVATRAMAASRDDRFQSAREMQRALGDAVGIRDMSRHTMVLHALRTSGTFRRDAVTVDEAPSTRAVASSPEVPRVSTTVDRKPTRRSSTRLRLVAIAGLVLGALLGVTTTWTEMRRPEPRTRIEPTPQRDHRSEPHAPPTLTPAVTRAPMEAIPVVTSDAGVPAMAGTPDAARSFARRRARRIRRVLDF
jgi:serine/threonine-protein kinase